MRYRPEHKLETHRKIVKDASRRVRAEGLTGTAVSAVMKDAGLTHGQVLAVEGPAWLLQDFDTHWDDPGRRERLLDVVRRVEADPSLLGASAHLLAIAGK